MSERLYRLQADARVFYAVERDGVLSEIDGDIFGDWRPRAPIAGGLNALKVLAPVVPSKIVAVGLNYRDHAAEQGKPLPPEPLIFLKPSTAVIGPGDAIEIPAGVGRVDHEAEAGIVIRHRASRVAAADALDY